MVLFWIEKVSWKSWERGKGKEGGRKRETHRWACTSVGEHVHTRASMHWAKVGIEGGEESWKDSAPNSRIPLSPSTSQHLPSTLL